MPLKEDPLRAVYFGTMDNPFDLETVRTVEETDKMFGEKEILGEQKLLKSKVFYNQHYIIILIILNHKVH